MTMDIFQRHIQLVHPTMICARDRWGHLVDTNVLTYALFLSYGQHFLMCEHDHRGSMGLLYNGSCILDFCFMSKDASWCGYNSSLD